MERILWNGPVSAETQLELLKNNVMENNTDGITTHIVAYLIRDNREKSEKISVILKELEEIKKEGYVYKKVIEISLSFVVFVSLFLSTVSILNFTR